MNRFLAITLFVVLAAAQFALPVEAATPAAAPAALSYTAMGDSLAYGILDFGGGGYVQRYGTYLQADTGSSVYLNNLGQNGWTSSQLLNALRTNSSFRGSVAASQIVTWDIGGNDFLRIAKSYQEKTCGGADNQDCLRNGVANFKANWSAIIAEILALRSTSNTVIRTMDIYNPFVTAQKASDSWPGDNGLSDFQAIKPYLDETNNYIASTAAANNIPCAKVYQAFNGAGGDEDAGSKGYISPYDYSGVHPGELGHKVIADLFRNLGYAPLVGQGSVAAPVLLTEENSNRAAALDSVTMLRAPFPVKTTLNFSPDERTRVLLFAANLELMPGEDASAVTVQAEDSGHRIYTLLVENVQKVPGLVQVSQVTVKLPDELVGAGDVSISLGLRGVFSNKAVISIR
jgi:lysophospholipase L1-like esterase